MELVFAADIRPLREGRRRLGLPEHRNELLTNKDTGERLLLPVSPQWFPRPSDWPETTVLTGFIPWEPPGSELAADVTAVLDDGTPPVLVTLSTSAATNAQQVFELLANTLDELGLRGLFLVADESNVSEPLRDRPGSGPSCPCTSSCPDAEAVVHSARRSAPLPRSSRPGCRRWPYRCCSTRSGTRTALHNCAPGWCSGTRLGSAHADSWTNS